MYAIIDIETTGGSPAFEKITEIALIVHDGNKVISEFSTLINPEKDIPYYITNLTGINNEMVANAPKFYEVAKKVIELTQGCVFVAHNVSFDYHFIRSEYKRLGYDFARKKLCTVQLSRKLLPGFQSYSLGTICQNLNIEINGRHRALGDATATVKLFEHLMSLCDSENQFVKDLPGLNKTDLHPSLQATKIETLPELTGVYYFYDDRNDLIYIGKSKNIRNRVYSHLSNFSTKKAIEMRLNAADISYEVTGSELISLLKESHEIKMHKPKYNRAQRRSISQFGLYNFIDSNGYIQFFIASTKDNDAVSLFAFSSLKSGKNYLQNLVDEYSLCQKLCGLYPTTGACFHYEIAQCHGACIEKELPDEYNARAIKVIQLHSYQHNSFFVVEKGRSDNELGAVLIEKGKYIGYGFLSSEYFNGDIEILYDCIQKSSDNRDVQQIVRNYISHHNGHKLIPIPNLS